MHAGQPRLHGEQLVSERVVRDQLRVRPGFVHGRHVEHELAHGEWLRSLLDEG